MANETITIETLFTDYVDKFSDSFISDTTYATEKVVWVKPPSKNTTDLFDKQRFITKIGSPSLGSVKPYTDTLTQLELSCITPTIELFRRDYKSVSKKSSYIDRLFSFNNTSGSYGFDLANKFAANFKNSSGQFYYNPNQFAAGIKSIDYVFAGTNPVESERAIDVTITFAFSSFDALVGKQIATPGLIDEVLIRRKDNTVIDPTDWINGDGKKDIKGVTRNFLSLITYPPSFQQIQSMTADTRAVGTADLYIPNYFEIFLKLGWRAPNTDIVNKEIFNSKQDFIKLINNGDYDKLILLNLVNHELTITEEGTIELKVNYIGSFETKMMGSTDFDFLKAAFKDGKKQESNTVEEEKQLKNISEYLTKCQAFGADEGRTAGFGPETIADRRRRLEERVKEKKENVPDPNAKDINNYYDKFLNYVITENPNILKVIYLNEQALERYDIILDSNFRDDTVYNLIERTTRENSLSTSGILDKAAESARPLNEQHNKQAKGEKEDPTNPSLSQTISSVFSSFSFFGNNKDKPLEKYEDEYIVYFSFGQLLDTIVKFISINTTETVVPFIDPRSPMEDVTVVLGDFVYTPRGGSPLLLPIHAVPITLNSFLVWFKDYISSKQRLNYPFRELLNDLVNGLLVPSLKGITPKNATVGGNYAPFIEYVQHGLQFAFSSGAGIAAGTTLPTDTVGITDLNSIDQPRVGDITVTRYRVDKTLIYISLVERGTPGQIFKDIGKDRKNGISHFFVGDTKGMIKSIKFKRIDQPGLKEAKATKDGFIPLNQLRDLYAVDITMYGNHYYYPGQLIYVHPFVSVMGEPYTKGTVSNIMGIGGYYNVIKVSSVISNDNYETTLDCMWSSSGEEHIKPDLTQLQRKCMDLFNSILYAREEPPATPATADPSTTRLPAGRSEP